jgi:hypothetical protein
VDKMKTITVPANRNARTGSGLFITDDMPYLTVTSSGHIDLQANRPGGEFDAPRQLEIYVGGVFLSAFYGAAIPKTSITQRGEVTARIRDTNHRDNSGAYTVTITVSCA